MTTAKAMGARRPRKPDGPRCRHCGFNKACRPRGLCSPCGQDPAVRAQHSGKLHRCAVRGVADFCGPGATPAPTDAPPGTRQKLDVLIARAGRGEALFHPKDAGNPDDRAGWDWLEGDHG